MEYTPDMARHTIAIISARAKDILAEVPKGIKSLLVSRLVEAWDENGRNYSVLSPQIVKLEKEEGSGHLSKPKINLKF